MKELSYTLVSDGSSDRALLPLLTWLLRQHLPADWAIQSAWADLHRLPRPRPGMAGRIQDAVEFYPCDLLFVHRDAEGESRAKRVEEIRGALPNLPEDFPTENLAVVCVIPVHMQEAWLLFDEPALRRAAGNPNGRDSLTIPALRAVEKLADPKAILHQLLKEARGLKGRRRARFSPHPCTHRIAEFVADFSPLRQLWAFRALEKELEQPLEERGWRDC